MCASWNSLFRRLICSRSNGFVTVPVHFLKNLQNQLQVDLFDRMRFAYKDENGNIQSTDRASFANLYAIGTISDSTLVVDTLVKTKKDLSTILKPLKESWHSRMV